MVCGYIRRIVWCTLTICLLADAATPLAQQARKVRGNANAVVSAAADATQSPDLSPAYRIGAGDVLHISVWRQDNLNQDAVVRTDGKISLPLVSEVAVAGKTPLAVQKMLTESYSEFIARPEVTVTVTEVNSQIVYILGEVQKPGAYPFVQSLGPLQLIARAGGLTPFAKKHSIYLLRGGNHQRVQMNFSKLVKGEGAGANLLLVSGDTVVVP